MKSKKIIKLTILIFILCFLIGIGLSLRKPLWNDESFSQSQNIELFSYKELFLGQTKYEGNKCPLFYVMQKAFTQLIGYQFPYVWEQQWLIYDVKSQLLLRLNPNFFMSLAISLVFFYFAFFYSLRFGFFSFAATLSFYMTWFYWVDARPYAMWFCFSIMQLLLFLSLLREVETIKVKRLYQALMCVNFLLAFTISISVAQIAIISFFLWGLKERNFLKHIGVTLLPIAVGLSYYLFMPARLTRYFPLHNPLDLFFACVGQNWILFFSLYLMIAVYIIVARREKLKNFKEALRENQSPAVLGICYLGVIFLMYLAAGALLATLMARIVPAEEAVHYIHERYFMFLVPVAIVGINLFSFHLMQIFKNDKWMLFNVFLLLSGLIIMGYFDTVIRLVAQNLYL